MTGTIITAGTDSFGNYSGFILADGGYDQADPRRQDQSVPDSTYWFQTRTALATDNRVSFDLKPGTGVNGIGAYATNVVKI
jgi:hypothetical protein